MVLYIDETENDQFFILAGLLVDSDLAVEEAYRHFKNSIKGIKLSNRAKSKVYTEFKATLLDKEYQKIKQRMLESITDLDCKILYSCYLKNGIKLNQVLKESIYITLLSSIVSAVDDSIEIVFDCFNKKGFEDNIVHSLNLDENVISIHPADSQKVHGLQFADNICSVVRRHKSEEDILDHYSMIKVFTEEV